VFSGLGWEPTPPPLPVSVEQCVLLSKASEGQLGLTEEVSGSQALGLQQLRVASKPGCAPMCRLLFHENTHRVKLANLTEKKDTFLTFM
jgi:hypothetical protein